MKTAFFAFALLLATSSAVFASADEVLLLDGTYNTFTEDNQPDIQVSHTFAPSGDYKGSYADETGARKEVIGVYEAKPSVCTDTTGIVGNLTLHYDEVQCCLSAKHISDKLVITYVSSNDSIKGESGVCRSHLVKKTP